MNVASEFILDTGFGMVSIEGSQSILCCNVIKEMLGKYVGVPIDKGK